MDSSGNVTLNCARFSLNGAWLYYILRYAGPSVIAKDLFGNKADKKETPKPIYLLLFIVFGGVGLIEILSICFRPISLSFRLYGNVFGGESLLHSMYALGQTIGGAGSALGTILSSILLLPFYVLDTYRCSTSSSLYASCIVYIGLICNHGEDEHH